MSSIDSALREVTDKFTEMIKTSDFRDRIVIVNNEPFVLIKAAELGPLLSILLKAIAS